MRRKAEGQGGGERAKRARRRKSSFNLHACSDVPGDGCGCACECADSLSSVGFPACVTPDRVCGVPSLGRLRFGPARIDERRSSSWTRVGGLRASYIQLQLQLQRSQTQFSRSYELASPHTCPGDAQKLRAAPCDIMRAVWSASRLQHHVRAIK